MTTSLLGIPQAQIELDHGTGGGMSHELITNLITPCLGSSHEGRMEDSAVLEIGSGTIAMTTDSFVVDPVFFGNGDIGKLSVCGTVNDLAVSGATPRFLTLSLVLETGFPVSDLQRIVGSVREAAEEAQVTIVGGDTKVVRLGEVDGIFINTAGVGELAPGVGLGVERLKVGDAVIVTGFLGNHSIHILSLREGLGFDDRIVSDCAPLGDLVRHTRDAAPGAIRCLRDVTRGGLGTVLNEVADGAGLSIEISREQLPVQHETEMAADMLGLDPLYLANEGCICLFVDPVAAETVLEALRAHQYGRAARIVGSVVARDASAVSISERGGGEKVVELLYETELPRLC